MRDDEERMSRAPPASAFAKAGRSIGPAWQILSPYATSTRRDVIPCIRLCRKLYVQPVLTSYFME